MRRTWMAGGLGAAVVAVGLLAGPAVGQGPTATSETMIGSSGGGRGAATMTRGGTLVVRLAVPPGGGTWQVTKVNEKVLAPLGQITREKGDPTRPGQAAAQAVFRFRAAAGGRTTLELQCRQGAEMSAPADRTFVSEVTVLGAPAGAGQKSPDPADR